MVAQVLWVIFLGFWYYNYLQIMDDYEWIALGIMGIIIFAIAPIIDKIDEKYPKLIDMDKFFKWVIGPLFLPLAIHVSLMMVGFFNPFRN